MSLYDFIALSLKFFFVLTPFFGLSMFLTMTRGYTEKEQSSLAWRVIISATVICLIIFNFGSPIFTILGITLDAFRVGTGVLLFLSAITLINNTPVTGGDSRDQDIAVVPLAIPIIVGPATIGTLLVLGAEMEGTIERLVGLAALLLSLSLVGSLLLLSSALERILGRRGLSILSKITGLVLAALAAQMVLAGISHFFGLQGQS